MNNPLNTIAWSGAILFVFLLAAALTKNKLYSSILFAVGAMLFFLFLIMGCHTVVQGLSNIH